MQKYTSLTACIASSDRFLEIVRLQLGNMIVHSWDNQMSNQSRLFKMLLIIDIMRGNDDIEVV